MPSATTVFKVKITFLSGVIDVEDLVFRMYSEGLKGYI